MRSNSDDWWWLQLVDAKDVEKSDKTSKSLLINFLIQFKRKLKKQDKSQVVKSKFLSLKLRFTLLLLLFFGSGRTRGSSKGEGSLNVGDQFNERWGRRGLLLWNFSAKKSMGMNKVVGIGDHFISKFGSKRQTVDAVVDLEECSYSSWGLRDGEIATWSIEEGMDGPLFVIFQKVHLPCFDFKTRPPHLQMLIYY